MKFEAYSGSHEDQRESGLSKVLNAPEEEGEKIHAYFKELFDTQQQAHFEANKTLEEERVIEEINQRMNNLVGEYGGQPLQITSDHIHIIDFDKLKPNEKAFFEKIMKGSAQYISSRQVILMKKGMPIDSFAKHILHEVIHFNSFQSYNFNGENKLSSRRHGLRMTKKGGDEEFFLHYDEAITEELVIRFRERYFKDIPELAEGVVKRDEWIKRLKPESEHLGEDVAWVDDSEKEPTFYRNSYPEYRKRFNRLLSEILKRNPDHFSYKEEVFKLFAQSYFTGNVLEVARIIESTFGEGSFRKLAEETKKK